MLLFETRYRRQSVYVSSMVLSHFIAHPISDSVNTQAIRFRILDTLPISSFVDIEIYKCSRWYDIRCASVIRPLLSILQIACYTALFFHHTSIIKIPIPIQYNPYTSLTRTSNLPSRNIHNSPADDSNTPFPKNYSFMYHF